MKLEALIISTLIIFSLSLISCSKEKPAEINKKVVIKKSITMTPEKKSVEQTAPLEEQAQATETKEPPEEKSIEQTTPVDEQGQVTEITEPEEIEKPEEIKKSEETKSPEIKEEGFYLAKGDESLSTIAGRKDVYGDPSKWILLYRFNSEAFDKIKKDETFPDKLVPAETRLEIVSPVDSEKISEASSKEHWVINVLSSPGWKGIVPLAINLVDNGYSVYFTRTNVKGRDYIRLRVGFYDERPAAEDAIKKITNTMDVSDLWTTIADESEFKEFGGYK